MHVAMNPTSKRDQLTSVRLKVRPDVERHLILKVPLKVPQLVDLKRGETVRRRDRLITAAPHLDVQLDPTKVVHTNDVVIAVRRVRLQRVLKVVSIPDLELSIGALKEVVDLLLEILLLPPMPIIQMAHLQQVANQGQK